MCNGRQVFFWYDSWTPFGPLIKFIGPNGPSTMRIPVEAKVSEVCNAAGWLIPPPRSDNALAFHTHLTTVDLPSLAQDNDRFSWVVKDMESKAFSSSKTWDVLRPREEEKRWVSSVWFK